MIKTYTCPNCGGDMVFDGNTQALICHHCSTTKTIEEMEHQETDSPKDEFSQKEMTSDNLENKGDFKLFHCPNCGAEVLTDLYTTATFCSYCGSPTLIESRLKDVDTPDFIIPFKTTAEQARESFLSWTKRGLFVPKSFRSTNTIEKITGLYVPFWLYDYHSQITLDALCTRTRRETRGDTQYIHTDHYSVFRDIDAEFLKLPVDASEKMDDQIMDQLEPFNYEDLSTFHMPFLSGFQSEKYNYHSSELKGRAEQRVNTYITSIARDTIKGYESVRVVDNNTNLSPEGVYYSLLPVWVLNYRYKDKNYSFTMNGQTGRIVATLPVSYSKMTIWFLSIFVIVFIIAASIGTFM